MGWFFGSIRNQLLGVFGLGMVLTVGAAFYGFYMAGLGLDALRLVQETRQRNLVLLEETIVDFKEQVQEWKNVLLRGSDPKLLDRYWNSFVAKEKDVRAHAQELVGAIEEPKTKELLVKFVSAHEDLGAKYRKGFDAFKASNFDSKVGDAAVRGIDRAPTELLDQAAKLIKSAVQEETTKAQESAQFGIRTGLVVMILFTLAGAVLGAVLIVKLVVRPIGGAARVAERVAAGDLAIRVEVRTQDETGRLFSSLREMARGLSDSVNTIRQSAESVATSSRELAAGNTELSSRTEEQASSLEETASSMEELMTTVKQNAENARQANQLAIGASDVASRGGRAMGEVIHTMGGISEASRRIADIIGVIDGIAFQTNILALNAAVEAARAGEQGRGFAVVASEVRSLAQRSAAAAKEIKGLIQTSVDRVDDGKKLVEGAGRTMEEIVVSVKRVTDIIAEIASASQEQLQGIEQVGQAVGQMDRVVQQNAAIVEESAAASENLAALADELTRTVARFQLASDGERGTATKASDGSQASAKKSANVVKLASAQRELRSPAIRNESAGGAAKPRAIPKSGGDGDWKEF